MSINHRAEAEKHLALAARHLTEVPADMRIAEVAASIGQGHAALATNTVSDDLREANDELSARFHATRRWVSRHIVHALVSGDHGRWLAARELAQGLDSDDASIGDLVDEHLAAYGHDSKAIWNDPYAVTPADDPWAADPSIVSKSPDIVRTILAARLAEMLLAPGSDEVHRWARNIAFELKNEGADLTGDIEKRITELTLGRDPSDPPF